MAPPLHAAFRASEQVELLVSEKIGGFIQLEERIGDVLNVGAPASGICRIRRSLHGAKWHAVLCARPIRLYR